MHHFFLVWKIMARQNTRQDIDGASITTSSNSYRIHTYAPKPCHLHSLGFRNMRVWNLLLWLWNCAEWRILFFHFLSRKRLEFQVLQKKIFSHTLCFIPSMQVLADVNQSHVTFPSSNYCDCVSWHDVIPECQLHLDLQALCSHFFSAQILLLFFT